MPDRTYFTENIVMTSDVKMINAEKSNNSQNTSNRTNR